MLLFRDGQEWPGALKLAIVVLVAVLPVAMPLVVTTALAVGALELSREQAIVQRLSAIEEMAGMNILCRSVCAGPPLISVHSPRSDVPSFHTVLTQQPLQKQ